MVSLDKIEISDKFHYVISLLFFLIEKKIILAIVNQMSTNLECYLIAKRKENWCCKTNYEYGGNVRFYIFVFKLYVYKYIFYII